MRRNVFIILVISFMMIVFKSTIITFDFGKVVYETTESYQKLLSFEKETKKDISQDKVVVRAEVKLADSYGQFVNDLNSAILEKKNKNYGIQEIKSIRQSNNEFLKTYHQQTNQSVDKKMSITGYEEKYVCKYSPYIEYIYNKLYFVEHQNAILKKISSIYDIQNVYVLDYNLCNYTPHFIDSTNCTGINDIYRSREFTGDGITIGLLEVGTPDVVQLEFQNTDCEIYKASEYGTTYNSSHASSMMRIIAGNDGIAPDASIKSAPIVGSIIDEIDWMVAKGVDIINMSFGDVDPQGVYGSTSAYIDYISYTYEIIMVAAVGNCSNNNPNISSPALGYNVISVGATNQANDSIWYYSSYQVADNQQPLKPTLVIRGDGVIIGKYSASGTSASTAITTANIAILLEKFPNLISKPERVIALLTANAIPFSESIYSATHDVPLPTKVGAGRLYLKAVFDNIYNIICFNNRNGVKNDDVYTVDLNVSAGQTIRVSTAWLAKTTGTVSGVSQGNYDLFLKTSDLQVLAYSDSSRSVVELLTYTFTQDMTCKIVVKQSADRVSSVDRICIAYQITDSE